MAAVDVRRLGGPAPLQVGAAAACVAAVLFVVVLAARGSEAVFSGDPGSYKLVAEDPFGDGDRLEPGAEVHGVAYRYGRILFPLLGWTLAGGQPAALRWTLPVTAVVALGVCAGLAAGLCRSAGAPAVRGLLVAGLPTLLAAAVFVYSEPVVVALLLGTYLAYFRDRRLLALGLAAALPLAREAALLGLLPIAVTEVRRRASRVVLMASALLPYVAWSCWVRWRVGEWPFLDPSVSRRDALGVPFTGLARAVDDLQGEPALVAGAVLLAAISVATVAAAVVAVRRVHGDPLLAWSALCLASIGLFLGAQPYRFPSEGFRVLVPAHVLLALLAARSPLVERSRPNHVLRRGPARSTLDAGR